MAYCGPKGIPLSRFLAWPEADQDAALAWQSHEAGRCSGCGQHPADAQAWAAEQWQCDGCAELARAREGMRRGPGGPNGVNLRFVRRDLTM